MNTQKTIGISMIALLAVALSVSMAAADDTGFTASPSTITLGDNSEQLSAFTVTWHGSDVIDSTWCIYKDGTGPTDDLKIRPTGTSAYASSGPQNFGATSSVVYDLIDAENAASAPGDTYYIQFADNDGIQYTVYVTTVQVGLIPEFATIAIPVVALLGLVFFMRRKEQK